MRCAWRSATISQRVTRPADSPPAGRRVGAVEPSFEREVMDHPARRIAILGRRSGRLRIYFRRGPAGWLDQDSQRATDLPPFVGAERRLVRRAGRGRAAAPVPRKARWRQGVFASYETFFRSRARSGNEATYRSEAGVRARRYSHSQNGSPPAVLRVTLLSSSRPIMRANSSR
jgi:hypothetical protein